MARQYGVLESKINSDNSAAAQAKKDAAASLTQTLKGASGKSTNKAVVDYGAAERVNNDNAAHTQSIATTSTSSQSKSSGKAPVDYGAAERVNNDNSAAAQAQRDATAAAQ